MGARQDCIKRELLMLKSGLMLISHFLTLTNNVLLLCDEVYLIAYIAAMLPNGLLLSVTTLPVQCGTSCEVKGVSPINYLVAAGALA